jgi:hypothetical protein
MSAALTLLPHVSCVNIESMKADSTYHHGDLRAALLKVAAAEIERVGYESLSRRIGISPTGARCLRPSPRRVSMNSRRFTAKQPGKRRWPGSLRPDAVIWHSPPISRKCSG